MTRAERGWRGERGGPESAGRVVQLRGWPGLNGWRPPTVPTGYEDRLGERNALVLHAAADADADGDRFGLAAVLYVAGPVVVSAAVLVSDDLGRRHPETLAAIEEWAATHAVSGRLGAPGWQVLTLSAFFDPFARVGCGHVAFAPDAYTGGAFLIGADLGRFFGLVAEHLGAARTTKRGDRWVGGWTVHLPGWGGRRPDGRWYRRSPNRPELRMKARRVGCQLAWGACGKDGEGRRYGKRRPGRFVDLLSLAYALDADRGACFGEHRIDLGLDAAELPLAVQVDGNGAEQLAAAVANLHETALVLDARSADWFTTSAERAEGRGRLSMAGISSPGALAGELLARLRVTAPLAKFVLEDAEHRGWAESFHGGRNSFDERFVGWPFRCATFDLSSAFPAVAHLIGWWHLLTADRLGR